MNEREGMIKVTNKDLLATWCKLFKVKTKDGRELVGSFVPVGWSREMSDDLSKVEREDYFIEFQALPDDLDAQTSALGRVTTYAPRNISIMDIVKWELVEVPKGSVVLAPEERRLKSTKQKPRKTNIYYGTARLEHLNGDPYEILCPYCGENIKFHVSNTCPYCNALLFKKTSGEAKDKYSDILQLKSFCESNGIKCILTRRIEDFRGKLKDRDGYKITFLNGDVIQCADTNGYFEFYNCHDEVDGKWIGLQEAKSFVLRYKNWLDLNNKPNGK